ncbi:MAG: hypothetical protein ACK5T0_06855 [Vampirovibrionales bacterium]
MPNSTYFTRTVRQQINREKTPHIAIPEKLKGNQIARYVSQSLRKAPTNERIEELLRQAHQFNIELQNTQIFSSITNATVSTSRNLYREAIELIHAELERTPHTETASLRKQLSNAKSGLSALEEKSSQETYKPLTPKKVQVNSTITSKFTMNP